MTVPSRSPAVNGDSSKRQRRMLTMALLPGNSADVGLSIVVQSYAFMISFGALQEHPEHRQITRNTNTRRGAPPRHRRSISKRALARCSPPRLIERWPQLPHRAADGRRPRLSPARLADLCSCRVSPGSARCSAPSLSGPARRTRRAHPHGGPLSGLAARRVSAFTCST